MKRRLAAIVLAVLIVAPSASLAAAQSAPVAISVTVLATPLHFEVGPTRAFVVTPKTKTVNCAVAVTLEQWTYHAEGGRC